MTSESEERMPTADEGDVDEAGFDSETLDLAEDDEDLAAMEGEADDEAAPDDEVPLPDEAAAGNDAVTGDSGDVEQPGAQLTASELESLAEDEDLAAFEEPDAGAIADVELPDEDSGEPLEAGEPAGRTVTADQGDVDGPALDFDQLTRLEEDEELGALEGDEGLPDESGTLIDHPTRAPARKVQAATVGGILASLPVPVLDLLDTIDLSPEVAAAVSSILSVLGAVAAAYMTRERAVPAKP